MSKHDYDLIVIGAGSAGMVAADLAPKIGVRCALVERDRIGGDCLWTGCVPSKALIASARAAHVMRHADRLGLDAVDAPIDTARVYERMRAVQHLIAATDDNADRYRAQGVDVVSGAARILDGHTVAVDGQRLTSRFILIATGSRTSVPPIDGLEQTGYLTSENLFEQERAPRSLLIIGGGPIAVEMAQVHRRLGAEVTVIERLPRILPRDEPSLVDMLLARLRDEGVGVYTNAEIRSARRNGGTKELRGNCDETAKTWEAEEIVVAAGRAAAVEGLGLEQAGVKLGDRGVVVDENLRTAIPSIYACGDVAGRYLFTHSAAAEAGVALRNMFYPGSAGAPELVPWTTFTDPELAHAGMTEEEAARALGARNVRTFRWRLNHNDRARAEGETDGAIVVVTDAKFRIVGAHVLAPAAGEIIGVFTLAIARKVRLTPDMANLIQVYPTIATSISQVAAEATYGQLQRPFLRTVRAIYERLRRET